MDIAIEELGDTGRLVRLTGSLDIEGSEAVSLPLAALAGKYTAVIVDMSAVDYIASVGVGKLIQNAQAVERNGGKFVIASPSGLAADVLMAMKIDLVIPIHATLDEAKAALGL